jgi:hypothetical protein
MRSRVAKVCGMGLVDSASPSFSIGIGKQQIRRIQGLIASGMKRIVIFLRVMA